MHVALQVKANRRATSDKPCSEKHYKGPWTPLLFLLSNEVLLTLELPPPVARRAEPNGLPQNASKAAFSRFDFSRTLDLSREL